MPVDLNGTRADIVMDANSTIARENIGRLYEHYFGAATVEVTKNIRQMLNVPAMQARLALKELKKFDKGLIKQAYDYLLSFYHVISLKQFHFFNKIAAEEQLEHLADIIDQGVYVYYPVDNEYEMADVVRNIEKQFKPLYGPVSYVGISGQRCVTEKPVRIAPYYMMLLEKITDDWSAVSSGKLQHFGILSPMTKSEKYAYPFRNSPVRTIGETEGRIFVGYCGAEAIAEMMDRANNPTTHRQMVKNILSSNTPMNIDRVVDRNIIPLGGNKSNQLVAHIAMASGWRTVFVPEENIAKIKRSEDA